MSLLQSETPPSEEAKSRSSLPLLPVALFAVLLLALVALFGIFLLNRFTEVESAVADLGRQAEEAAEKSERALHRATEAEASALEAARGREQAETEAAEAQQEAESAGERAKLAEDVAENATQEAESAKQEAEVAREEAERIRREWESEVERLHNALNQIVETRKTALGLVMNLGSDYLKFDFDKATLRPENRELLSRIAGILLTAKDYSVDIYGHTDNIGTESYNQGLSESRAQAVRDYLVEAGIDPDIIATEGFGKTRPLLPGTTAEARAKNRRVEIGIVNTRIEYRRRTARPQE